MKKKEIRKAASLWEHEIKSPLKLEIIIKQIKYIAWVSPKPRFHWLLVNQGV
jgi:hypothetical protein